MRPRRPKPHPKPNAPERAKPPYDGIAGPGHRGFEIRREAVRAPHSRGERVPGFELDRPVRRRVRAYVLVATAFLFADAVAGHTDGALLVRIFIVQHDCGHGSILVPSWVNHLAGRLCRILNL